MSETRLHHYAVLGHPISHSKSPLIHQQFAQQFGFEIDYRAIDVAPGSFEQTVREFMAGGGLGCNVTVPYKQEAFELADELSGRAQFAGAVNTLKFEQGQRIFGDNTDGIGLLRDLTINLDQTLFGKRLLVLGAGGAVRGVLAPLMEQAPKRVVIANRTVSKAEELAGVFSTIGDILPSSFEALAGQRFDIVINGTAASLSGDVPPLPQDVFSDSALAYDLMYAKQPTAFMRWAYEHGAAQVSDGLGMLVEQAAESFYLWWGHQPDTAPVIELLRNG